MEFFSPNICSPFVHYKQANQITFAIACFVAHDGQESNFLLWFLRCDLHRIQVVKPSLEMSRMWPTKHPAQLQAEVPQPTHTGI